MFVDVDVFDDVEREFCMVRAVTRIVFSEASLLLLIALKEKIDR